MCFFSVKYYLKYSIQDFFQEALKKGKNGIIWTDIFDVTYLSISIVLGCFFTWNNPT